MIPSLQREPHLSLVTLKSVRHSLQFAQQRLLDPYIPSELKMRSYIRICCLTMRTYQRFGLLSNTAIISKTPYLTLLDMLSKHDINWWATCTVSSGGYLTSTDTFVEQLLSPLNQLVAQHLGHFAA